MGLLRLQICFKMELTVSLAKSLTSLVQYEIYWQSFGNFSNMCSTVLWSGLRQKASVECLLSPFGY